MQQVPNMPSSGPNLSIYTFSAVYYGWKSIPDDYWGSISKDSAQLALILSIISLFAGG